MFRSLSDLAVSGADQLLANPEVISLGRWGQTLYFSVADPECISWILILFHADRTSYNNKKGGEGKISRQTFFVVYNFQNIKPCYF